LSHCSNQRVRERDKSLDPHERQDGTPSDESLSSPEVNAEAKVGASADRSIKRLRKSLIFPELVAGG
jgi:hypothetical protein